MREPSMQCCSQIILSYLFFLKKKKEAQPRVQLPAPSWESKARTRWEVTPSPPGLPWAPLPRGHPSHVDPPPTCPRRTASPEITWPGLNVPLRITWFSPFSLAVASGTSGRGTGVGGENFRGS